MSRPAITHREGLRMRFHPLSVRLRDSLAGWLSRGKRADGPRRLARPRPLGLDLLEDRLVANCLFDPLSADLATLNPPERAIVAETSQAPSSTTEPAGTGFQASEWAGLASASVDTGSGEARPAGTTPSASAELAPLGLTFEEEVGLLMLGAATA